MNEKRDIKRLEEFGEHLRQLRTELGLSQRELSYRCDVDYGKISKIENAKEDFTFTTFLEIAKGLGIHPKELLNKDFDFLEDD
jgi:transcriptional regulator with XRE-family HTH domain